MYTFVLLVGASLLLRLFFSYTSLENLPLTSDESSSALLAQMISQGARPLLFVGQPYQFPIESYLFSLVSTEAPANPYGIRLFIISLGFLTTAVLLYCMWVGCRKEERWLPLLLVLFPSYYVLENFAAYTPPQYGIGRLLAVLAIALILVFRKNRQLWLLLCCGVVSGLVISNHLLYVSVVAGVGAMVLFQGNFRSAIKELPVYCAGLLLGLTPLILALYTIPGAYANLPQSVPFGLLGSRFLDVFSQTLPLGLGYDGLIFSDFNASMDKYLWMKYPLGYGFLVLLCVAVFFRARRVASSIREKKWPSLELSDLAIIVTIVTLFLLIRSVTAVNNIRYLLPALWIFPFWAGCFTFYNRKIRIVMTALLVFLVAFNIVVTRSLIKRWMDRDLLQVAADTPDLTNLIADLKSHGMDRCYGSFWLAYRITYESGGEIICSMPLNERFPYWPIPFKAEVDKAENAVYVLTQTPLSRLPTLTFEQHLYRGGVTCQRLKSRHRIGSFNIFHSFQKKEDRDEVPVADTDWSLSVETSDAFIQRLNQSDFPGLEDEETSGLKGFTAVLDLKEKRAVSSLAFRFLLPFSADNVGVIRFYDDAIGWVDATGLVNFQPDRFAFINDHPVYGKKFQKITFVKPLTTDKLRIDFVTPGESNIFNKVEVYAEKR